MSIAAASLLRRSGGAVRRYYHVLRRSFATQTPEIGNQRRQQQQLPWLLLSSPDNPESRYLYDLTGDDRKPIDFNREIHFPRIAGHHLIGSSQGYLLSVDDTADIHATDPLTGARLPIPSTAALPNFEGVIRDPAGNITDYVTDSFESTDPREPILGNVQTLTETVLFERSRRVGGGCGGGGGGEIFLLTFLDPNQFDSFNLDSMKNYYFRVILSPSFDTAVVIHNPYSFMCSNRPAFARIGSSSSSASSASPSSWNALYSPSYCFQDVIFHQGRLHAVDFCGTLVVFDLDDPLGQPFVSPEGPKGEDSTVTYSLVESPDGEDLFLVLREIEIIEIDDAFSDDYPPKSDDFKVFKLDKSIYKWNQVDSIGDVAIFLGCNQSIAISASDFSSIIRPNCIYFADNYRVGSIHKPYWHDRNRVGYIKPNWVGDTGVYNLGDDRIKYYELSDGLQKFNWPPPIWFMPPAP